MPTLAEARRELDPKQLLDDIEVVCRFLAINEAQACRQMRIPSNTLSKLRGGTRPTTDQLSVIFAWLDPSKARYLREAQASAEQEVA